MIAIQNLNYKANGQVILSKIELAIEANGIYGIIGPNGAGKSTLLKHMMGVLKVPQKTMFIEGEDVSQWSPRTYAKKCSIVFQENTKELDFTIEEIISMGRYSYLDLFGTMTAKDKKIINELLELFGLNELKDRPLKTLSGGEAQKVFIARALAQQAPILLLDEPTSMLDMHSSIELLHSLKKIQEKYPITIVMVMHDLNLTFQFCEHVIVLKNGRVIEAGDAQSVLRSSALHQVYNNKLQLIEDGGRTYIVPQVDTL